MGDTLSSSSTSDGNQQVSERKREGFYSLERKEWKKFIQDLLEAGEDINERASDGDTILSYAAEYGDEDIVEYLIEIGADVNVENTNGSKPLHIAAKFGNIEVLEMFLKAGVHIDSCDSKRSTPLHYAAEKGQIAVVKYILENNAAFDEKNLDRITPIFLAAEHLHKEVVAFLLDAGRNITTTHSYSGYTLLHHASKNGWLEIAQNLVARGVELDKETQFEKTAILLAAENSHEAIVKLLLDAGAKINGYYSYSKRTLLHFASEKGWLDITKTLVQKGSDLNAKDSDGNVPLFIAAIYSNKEIVQLLIGSGADIDCCNKNGWTLMHYACRYGLFEVVESLIQMGKDANVKTSDNITPLIVACNALNEDIVKLLVDSGAHIECYDTIKRNVIHYASEYGWMEVVQALVMKGIDLNAKTSYDETPLLLSALRGHKNIVELLIDSGTNINCNKVTNALRHVIINGWRDVVESLCEKGIDLNAQTDFGETPLLTAAKWSRKDIVELLISFGANIDCYDDNHWTVLHYASYNEWIDIVQSLVLNGADPNARDSRGCTPLFFAACRHKDIFELLIDSNTNVNCSDNKGWTVLHHISQYGWIEEVGSLFKKGADLNAKTSKGETPMLLAAQQSKKDLVEEFIHLGANMNCCDGRNFTVLHHASREGWLDVVESLLAKGIDPDVKTSCGQTPLLIAASCGHREIVEILCNLTKDLDCFSEDNKWTVLHYVSLHGWLEVVKLLVKQGANLNVTDSKGLTPLLIAAERRPAGQHQSIVELLIDSGANLNCVNEKKWTVLHKASDFGWIEIAESLVKRGADLDVINESGKTALLIAANHSYTDIVSLLINAGADLECCNGQKWRVLHKALERGWLNVMKSLAKKEVNFNKETPSGELPLLIAAKNKQRELVLLLIELGVEVDCCDDRKWTVLHYAVFYKWTDVVFSVVEKGCNVNAKNCDDGTPLHLVCNFSEIGLTEQKINACLEIAKLLVEKGVDVNAKSSAGNTLIHVMCNTFFFSNTDIVWVHLINLCIELVELFVKKGFDINSRNEDGTTPLLVVSQLFYHIGTSLALKCLTNLFRIGADCNISNNCDETPFRICIWIGNIDIIKLCIANGACLNEGVYIYLSEDPSVKEGILKDINVCSQLIINTFYKQDMPALYKLVFPSGNVPSIDKMKIARKERIVQEVKDSVRQEIQTKGYCNVMEVSPIHLFMLSVKCISNYYTTKIM